MGYPRGLAPAHWLQWLGVFLLGVVLVFGQTQQSTVPWTCEVCEDVMQIWHDMYRCAGNFWDNSSPLEPGQKSCKLPLFDCTFLAGVLSQACWGMVNNFKFDSTDSKVLWEMMMTTNDPYQTCVKLGRCGSDPDPQKKQYTPCHWTFEHEDCKNNIKCKRFTKNCTQDCYLCNWIVQDFPIFQQACKPPGAQLPPDAVQPTPQPTPKTSRGLLSLLPARDSEGEGAGGDTNSTVTVAPGFNQTRGDFNQQGVSSSSSNSNSSAANSQLERRLREKLQRPSPPPVARKLDMTPLVFDENTFVDPHTLPPARKNSRRLGLLGALEPSAAAAAFADMDSMLEMGVGAGTKGEEYKVDNNEVPQKPLQTEYTVTEYCFTLWDWMKNSRKAKFFASWKAEVEILSGTLDRLQGNMWDANIACKCVGKCPLKRFEELGLEQTCNYDERDEMAMQYLFQSQFGPI